MYVPEIIVVSLIVVLLFIAEKYLPTSNFMLPKLARPHLDALRIYLASYNFEFKKDLIKKAKEALKEDYEIFRSGNYKSDYYKENYFSTMFFENSQYKRADVAETWALCAILDFNGNHSRDPIYEDLCNRMKTKLLNKFKADKCPVEIYECFTNSNNTIEAYKSSMQS